VVKNSAGEVLMRHYQDTPKYVRLGNGHEYVFTLRSHVSATWVKEEDVQPLLEIRHKCCPNSNPKSRFRYATEQELAIWSGHGDVHPR